MIRNILYVHFFSPVGGGGDESLYYLCKGLNRGKYNPYILSTSVGPVFNKFRKNGFHISSFQRPPSLRKNPSCFAFRALKFALFIMRNNIRLVHVNYPQELTYVLWVCKILRIPCICHLRSLLLARNLNKRAKNLLNHTDGIVAITKAVKDAFVGEGLKEEKVAICYNGIDLEEFNPETATPQVFRIKFNVPDDSRFVGMAGRLVAPKGCEEFLQAASLILRTLPNAKFVLIGDSPRAEYLESLKTRTHQLGISSDIFFTGLEYDMPSVYAGLDVFALPSWEEPFGRVVCEAMAMNKPVVATNAGGVPEIIHHPINGLLVPVKDAGALAEAILEILTNGAKAEALARAGRETVQKRFSIERHVKEIETIYDSLL